MFKYLHKLLRRRVLHQDDKYSPWYGKKRSTAVHHLLSQCTFYRKKKCAPFPLKIIISTECFDPDTVLPRGSLWQLDLPRSLTVTFNSEEEEVLPHINWSDSHLQIFTCLWAVVKNSRSRSVWRAVTCARLHLESSREIINSSDSYCFQCAEA